MSLDAWGVKLKAGVPVYLANWDTIEDLDETDILPKSNYFYNHTYSNIHQSFIKYVLNYLNYQLEFTGDPCCSMETIKTVSEVLNSYIKDNPKDIYDWIDQEGNKKVLIKKEVDDLSEYLCLLVKNGFVMWFSF